MGTKLRSKLIASHLGVGIVPLLLISGVLWIIAADSLETVGRQGTAAVEHAAYDQLDMMCRIKEKQIASFFKTMQGGMLSLVGNPWLLQAFAGFEQAFAETEVGGLTDSDAWKRLAAEHDPMFNGLCADLDWHNLFLINAEGSIVYSVSRNSDLGLSLSTIPLASSSLGRAFAQLEKDPGLEIAFGDYAPYAPLNNEPSAFLITRLRNGGSADKRTGYLAVQPSTEALRGMIKMATDRKNSVEAYLVGADGFMRSDSVLDPEHYSRSASYSLGNKVNTVASQNAIAGRSGTGIIQDYRSKTVLSSWRPVDVFGVRWALICEVDEDDALAARTAMNATKTLADRRVLGWISTAALLTFLVVWLIALFISRSISRPIVHAAKVAGLIAAGDLSQRLAMNRADEIGQLADALDAMVDKVARNLRRKTGAADLAEQMRGQLNVRALAKNAASFLAKFVNAQMSALYLADQNGDLVMSGSYAFNRRKALNSQIKIGEGIAGQAAVERTTISVTDLPEDYMRISSALGEAAPRNVLAVPFLYEDKLVGVIELASFKEFSDADMGFLEEVSESVAIVFDAARRRQEVQDLLEETQRQSEELRQQGEELRATNEELEVQTAALKEFQEELEAQQAELEVTNARLKEKTEALLSQRDEIEQRNRDLIAAREEVEERSRDLAQASKYKSQFLANMSHELRTPLNSLLLLAGSLAANKDGNLTVNQQEAAKVIADSGKDLLNLINEILDLAKIEAGRVELDLEEVAFEELAENARKVFRHMAEIKKLEFSVSVDPALPPAFVVDRKRLEQVLKNFLSNSIKFTERGWVQLSFARPAAHVKLQRADMQDAVAISVADSGIGIPSDKQKIIFEAFQQADGSTGRKYGGTGLGLSISRELANLLGGEIQLSSEQGHGSVFTLYLPLRQGEAAQRKEPAIQPQERPHPAPAALPPSPGRRAAAPQDDRDTMQEGERSILIIEDDRKFAAILVDQCRQRGFKAAAADTGEEGLKLAEQFQPSGIILDIKLPGIDGWTVLAALKSSPVTRHIPVHMMSVEEGSREALRQGAIGFFTKPVAQEQIAEALARFEAVGSRTMKRLLVVEDDDVLRRAVVELIGGADIAIEEAKTGSEAHALLHKGQADCMVLDLGLPDCTGLDLLRRLAAEPGFKVPPVIIYTGRELTRDEEKELSRYAESIIIKNARSRERLLDEVSLFLHRMAEERPGAKQEIIASLDGHEDIFKGKKILLVDDDMRNCFALSAVLEERGMTVTIAEDGRKALEALDADSKIDLVLMDIMMPEMDGYEATRRIRQQRQFRDLPVIALTAKAMKEDREKCVDAGASDYLAKPVDLERLLSMMRVWLYQ